MQSNYSKFLGSKIFLIEQVATKSLKETNAIELQKRMKEILDIAAASLEDVNKRMGIETKG